MLFLLCRWTRCRRVQFSSCMCCSCNQLSAILKRSGVGCIVKGIKHRLSLYRYTLTHWVNLCVCMCQCVCLWAFCLTSEMRNIKKDQTVKSHIVSSSSTPTKWLLCFHGDHVKNSESDDHLGFLSQLRCFFMSVCQVKSV